MCKFCVFDKLQRLTFSVFEHQKRKHDKKHTEIQEIFFVFFTGCRTGICGGLVVNVLSEKNVFQVSSKQTIQLKYTKLWRLNVKMQK